MSTQRGISTITVIIVIAILVLVAAIAVPAWRQHESAARVDTALKAADAAKLVVMESATVHGGLANVKTSELGYHSAAITSPYVAHIDIADGGRITLTTKDTGATPDPVLVLVPAQGSAAGNAGILNWSCSVAAGDMDMVPGNCRTENAASAPVAPPSGGKSAASVPAARSS